MNSKALRTIIGGVLIHLSIGAIYTASNMITYIISYIHVLLENQSITMNMSSWLFAISIMGQACSMMIAGKIETSIGSRWCTILGCLLFDLCVVTGYWTVNNFYALLAIYGFGLGFAIGIAYSAPISMAIKWMPKSGGLATGVIVAGFGCGPLIFNQVQSRIINPKNIPAVADPLDPSGGKYFPAEVVKKVPQVFLILAASYFILQLVGILLVAEPTEQELEEIKAKDLPITGDLKVKGTGYTPREFKPHVEATPRGQHMITASGATVDHPYKPSEAMKTAKFWEIWSTFLCVGLTTTFMSSYWKPFGQSFIDDDHFLVMVGSVSSVCNGLFRPIWGTLMDKWTYRKAMPFLCVITALLISTLSFTSNMNRWMFFIWVCLIYLCIGGFYAMFPAYTSLSFGNLYMVGNYGWVFTNQFISSFVSAFFVNAFITKLGNLGITLVLGAMILLAACLSGFGKKWDYHVGRRELHPTSISAALPPTFVLPPNMVEAEKKTEVAEKPVAEKPVAEVVNQPATEVVEKPATEVVEKPATEVVNQPAVQANQPATEANQSTTEANQPATEVSVAIPTSVEKQ